MFGSRSAPLTGVHATCPRGCCIFNIRLTVVSPSLYLLALLSCYRHEGGILHRRRFLPLLCGTLIVDLCPCRTNQYIHCPTWNLDGNPSDVLNLFQSDRSIRLLSMFRVTAKHYPKHSMIPSKD
jgi:hypothetical protein